jgi:hypothetical protein
LAAKNAKNMAVSAVGKKGKGEKETKVAEPGFVNTTATGKKKGL